MPSYGTKSKLWFLDGTFRVVGEPLHQQLVTIHLFLKSGDTMKQVQLCFVLMSRWKKQDYIAVLNATICLLLSEPVVVIVHFEKAVWGALSQCLSGVICVDVIMILAYICTYTCFTV